MSKPEYTAPQTLDEALSTLGKQTAGAQIIAGGTDLIPRMRARMVEPSLLVDLRLLGMDSIDIIGDRIHIGARTTHTGVLESDILAEHCLAIITAARDIAGPPIRNRGTVGGNLVNASPAADLATPLLVHDAIAVLAKAGAQREVPLADFFTGPGATVLASDELLKEITIPTLAENSTSSFIKLGKRKAMAIAVVSVAARLALDEDGNISQARIALGSVAPIPMRAVKAEAALEGQAPSAELFAEAGNVARKEATPISDLRASGEYRSKMVAVLTRRALAAAWQRLGGQ